MASASEGVGVAGVGVAGVGGGEEEGGEAKWRMRIGGCELADARRGCASGRAILKIAGIHESLFPECLREVVSNEHGAGMFDKSTVKSFSNTILRR